MLGRRRYLVTVTLEAPRLLVARLPKAIKREIKKWPGVDLIDFDIVER